MKVIHDQSFGIIPLRKKCAEWEVLVILHRGGNHWGFPKGHANPEETSAEAASRELKEETGLTVVEFLSEQPKVETYLFRRKRILVSKKAHYFPAIVTGELLLQEEEIVDARWLSFEKALTTLSFEEARNILRETMKSLKQSK